jgi:hypothetical protein
MFRKGRRNEVGEVDDESTLFAPGRNVDDMMQEILLRHKKWLFASLTEEFRGRVGEWMIQLYIQEAEHMDGLSYWKAFKTAKDLQDDITLYVDAIPD